MHEDQKRQRRQRRRRRIPKKRHFRVIPLNPAYYSRRPRYARVALVSWENGKQIAYRFDHLTKHELDDFWKMGDSEKRHFLKRNCNRHHRKPRCQDGETSPDNLSYVDIFSHVQYNYLVKEVACWCDCQIQDVFTRDISHFLRVFYQEMRVIMSNPDSDRIVGLPHALKKRKNIKQFRRRFLLGIARWSGVAISEVSINHVHRFIRYLYFPLKRLAFDCESGKLKTLSEFVKVLNAVWLPRDEPIRL